MTRWLAILTIAAAASVARADSLRLMSNVMYDTVTITSVGDGVVYFRAGPSDVKKPLAEVAKVELSGSPEYNKAEELLTEKKFADAATGFGAVAKSSNGWRKTLAQYRQMTALEFAGKIDESLSVWLELADAAKASPATLALRPRRMPAKGDAANDRAVALLKARMPSAQGEAYQRTIAQAMAELYERQGNAVEAQAALQATSAAVQSNQLRMAMAHYRQGEFDKAAAIVEGNMKDLSPADLPAGLLMLGQCQIELAKSQKDATSPAKRELLLKAGLNFMRVVSEFSDGDESAQALFLAGGVNEQLGNLSAARSAYEAVVTRYGQSPFAKQAAAAINVARASRP